MDHWYPWTLADISSIFQNESGLPYSDFVEAYVTYMFPDSILLPN